MQSTLFSSPTQPTIPARASHGFTLRDFQAIDADKVCLDWNDGHLHVLIVHATGLGKSLMAAELAGRKPAGKKSLVVVDSTDLSKDLYRTIYQHLGRKP